MASKHKPMKPQTAYGVVWKHHPVVDYDTMRSKRYLVAFNMRRMETKYEWPRGTGRIIKLRVTEVSDKKRRKRGK